MCISIICICIFFRIKTKFFVIDPSVEAAQARLNAMRTGRYTASKPQKGPIPISDKTKLDKTSILDYRSVNSHAMMSGRLNQGGTRGGTSVTPLPPPMVSTSCWILAIVNNFCI